MKSIKKTYSLIIMTIFFIAPFFSLIGAEEYSHYFYAEDIADGAYLGSLDDQFHVSFPADTYNKGLSVYINESSVDNMPVANIGNVYSYYILSSQKPAKEFELAIRFTSDSIQAKHIWLYDYKANVWEKLLTRVDQPGRLAIATTDKHYGKVILSEDEPVSIEAGEEVLSFDNMFSINMEADGVIDIESYNMNMYSEELPRVSSIYQYDMHLAHILEDPIRLVFNYEVKDWKMPTVYYWDKSEVKWQELITTADLDKNEIYASTVLPYSRVALFMKPDVWAGEASWYKYKDCDCAASRDYPKGAELKITHLSSGKTEVIKVNDYGPELWTHRIIDLDATVFKKLISLGAGVTDVRVELVK
ncbi:MAG: septal ring lytic transglycosylase RlpA family protein [Candidatus Komeilibacteria bacterium]